VIIDTFPFNRDFKALEIRFNELIEVVDLFVVSESWFTHSGKKKPLYLKENINRLDMKIQNKLVVLSDEKTHIVKNPRIREMIQRERISKFLREIDLSSTDLILHSDCDEIPRATTLLVLDLKSSDTNVDAILELDNYANYLNLSSGKWLRGRVQSFSLYKGIQNMRKDIFLFQAGAQRRHSLPFIRVPDFWTTRRFGLHLIPSKFEKLDLQIVPNAGWHFNNLFLKNEIIKKIENSSHVEWNTDRVRDRAIKNFESGCDIYTGMKLSVVKIDETFPKYITSNLDQWAQYIYTY